jgi:ABC-2 type transport system permease protein
MEKVLLIIQREYLTRVRKRAFIIMTLLVPCLIAAMFAIVSYLATQQEQTVHKIYVLDENGAFKGKFHDSKSKKYVTINLPLSVAKDTVQKHEDDLLLFIPSTTDKKDSVTVYAKKKNTLSLADDIQTELNNIATGSRMVTAHIDTVQLHKIKSNIVVQSQELTDAGAKSANVGASYALGFAGAILIYMSLFIYGAQVMRGVIEEKTSRIVEVIVSSVKPFQLMLGKIIGVGLVGLTQFVLWILLSTIITKLVGGGGGHSAQPSPVMAFTNNLGENIVYELSCFIFYWLTGYLLYSALFAAVGSAVDSETETQQFMFPITLPLLFAYVLSVSYLFQAPDSPLAVWLSIIPLTAPVVMMVRIPFGVPGWQLGLSMFLMLAGFLFTTYIASRIYRVGILMYGKKPSYKEMVKWFFYKE